MFGKPVCRSRQGRFSHLQQLGTCGYRSMIEGVDGNRVKRIGGLGHLALQFARAWGCHVTAFTSSGPNQQEALDLGAHDTINSRDPEAIKGVKWKT